MAIAMGIDSGSNLGIATIEANMGKREKFKLLFADSVKGDDNNFGFREDVPNQSKAIGLTRVFSYYVELLGPDSINCEDNFLQMSASSFKRLIEMVTMMSYHNSYHNPNIPFHLVLPRLAKQLVGADFRGSDKNDVKEGLKKCKFLDLNGYDLDNLTEHAVDAILIALYECVQMYKRLGWEIENGASRKPKT